MSASNLIVALDAMTAYISTVNRINAAISLAVAEDRDITVEELSAVGVKTDELVDRVNAEL